jgi:hypothetical protein
MVHGLVITVESEYYSFMGCDWLEFSDGKRNGQQNWIAASMRCTVAKLGVKVDR